MLEASQQYHSEEISSHVHVTEWYAYYTVHTCSFLIREILPAYLCIAVGSMRVKIGPAIGVGLFAGFFEEFGWSGFMLPKLQQRFNPLMAALLVGLFWGGVWHPYADYIGDFGKRRWWATPLVIFSFSSSLKDPSALTAK